MADIAQPPSFSVYRGQSRSGEGEGPGRTVLQGEQYMLVDRALYHPDVLDAIRTWMTLDSDPADHQRLRDQLEGWSLFSTADYLFVVRLVSAGVYDRRAAYFAHGRAWSLAGLPVGCDPGLHLGRSEAFDAPWRDSRPPEVTHEAPPSLVRPDQIGAEPEAAALFLGHLLQAIVDDTPLIIAAPVADFTSGSPLQALVSFARAALPADLRRKCRIRVYSRFPDLFLRHLRTHLLAIPEDAASAALTAQPAATLLDRLGRRISGKELSQVARDYAEAVVERAIAIPDGLPYFVERFRRQPSANNVRAVQITYNLAFAMAGTPDRRADFLRKYLPRAADKLGETVDWDGLIGADEWNKFPREALVDQLLTDARDLSRGRRAFLRALEAGVSRLDPKLELSDRLWDWWNAADPSKPERLVELLTNEHPLVSPRVASQLTSEISVVRLHRTDFLDRVLAAESENGFLEKRAHESADLGHFANEPKIFDILNDAVAKGRFGAEWARVFIRTASAERITRAAELWLGNGDFYGPAWGDVPERLLDRLRELDPVPAATKDLLKEAGRRIKPQDRLELFVRMADLQTRIDQAEGGALLSRLWHALPSLEPSQKQFLEKIAFEKGWICFDLEHLDLKALLDFAEIFQEQSSYERIYRELDSRMTQEAKATTNELIRKGWWYFWRCRSQLYNWNFQQSALSWMNSDVWSERADHDVTLETWNQVVSDLPDPLTGDAIAGLRKASGGHRWPWIPPFEEQQIDDLIQRVKADHGALAELADSVRPEDWPRPAIPIHEYVLMNSLIDPALPMASFQWLLERPGSADVLSLEQSTVLLNAVDHRRGRAARARVESVAEHMNRDPNAALQAADDPSLWKDGQFLYRIADWMNRKGSLKAIGHVNAAKIHKSKDGEPAQLPDSPSLELVRELAENGFHGAADLLQPQLSSQIQHEQLASDAVTALLQHNPNHACWQRLAKEVKLAEALRAERHPLITVAEKVGALPREQKKTLAKFGWKTFRKAAQDNPALMSQVLTEPLEKRTLLPLLRFVTTMRGPGTLANTAVALAAEVGDAAWRANMWLWYGLRCAVRDFKRYGLLGSADDRQDTAFYLMESSLESPAEEDAYERARKFESTAA